MRTKIIDKLVVIHLDVHLWSGRKRLRPEDLRVRGELPPADLVSLGSKKVCDPKALHVFERLRRRAERACQAVGVRFVGGYAIPEDKLNDLLFELDTCKAEFNIAKQAFLARYEQGIEEWAAAHPEWAEIIRRSVTPKSQVERQLRFGYEVFRVRPTEHFSEGLERQVNNLSQGLLSEVAIEAARVRAESFEGRRKITRRALRPVRSLRGKLDGLSFLNPRIAPLVRWMDDTLARVPKTGPIEGSVLSDLDAMLLVLSDPDKALSIGTARLNGTEAPEPEKAAGQAPDRAEAEAASEPEPETEAETEEVEVTLVEAEGELDEEPAAGEEAPPPQKPVQENAWFL